MGLKLVISDTIHSLKADYKPSLYYKDISHAHTHTKKEKPLHGSCGFMLCKIWKSFRIKLKLMT